MSATNSEFLFRSKIEYCAARPILASDLDSLILVFVNFFQKISLLAILRRLKSLALTVLDTRKI
jgi:hypothetical protein